MWCNLTTRRRLEELIDQTSEGLKIKPRSDERYQLRVMMEEYEKRKDKDDPEYPLLPDCLEEKLVFGWDALTDYEFFTSIKFKDAAVWEEPDEPMDPRFPLDAQRPEKRPEASPLPAGSSETEAPEAPDNVSMISAATIQRDYGAILRPMDVPSMNWQELEDQAWGSDDDGQTVYDKPRPPRPPMPSRSPDREDGGDSKEAEVDDPPRRHGFESSSGEVVDEPLVNPAAWGMGEIRPFVADDESEAIGGAGQPVRIAKPPPEKEHSVAFMLGVALMLATVAAVMN